MTRSTTRTVPVRPGPNGQDFPLTVSESGAGAPALVLHGGAGPASVDDLARHLAATGRHVLTPTHPGWDGTPRPDWFSGIDDLATTYLDLLDADDLHDVLVVGSSLGGWVAAEMAVRDLGRRIGLLVLLGASGPAVPGHGIRLPSGPGQGPPPDVVETVRAYAGATFADPKLLRRLAGVTTPALLVWGEDDPIVSPDFGRAYAAAFERGRFELVRAAGHLPTREAPETVFALIDQFVAEDTR